MIERLYIEVTTEVEEEYEKRRKSIKAPKKKLQNIDDAEEMWEFLEHSNNPADIEVCMIVGGIRLPFGLFQSIELRFIRKYFL